MTHSMSSLKEESIVFIVVVSTCGEWIIIELQESETEVYPLLK